MLVRALDAHGLRRAVLVGHSLGSAYVSYAVQSDAASGARRVGGVVLIDPIATNIHHSRTTREVVYTRLDTCQRSFEDFVFKKELWTSALVRKLPWHAASFRLDDCVPQTPSLIAVGELDAIVSQPAVLRGFGSWRARLRGVRVLDMRRMSHGEWLVNEQAGAKLVASVKALCLEAASIRAAEETLAAMAASDMGAASASASAGLEAAAGLATHNVEQLKESVAPPLESALLQPLASSYQAALARARNEREAFESAREQVWARAERSFEAFENEFAKRAGATATAAEVEAEVRRHILRMRAALESDFARAAAEVTAETVRSLDALERDSREVARLASKAAAEAARTSRVSLQQRDLARAASNAAEQAKLSLRAFEDDLADALESASAAAAEAEAARVALLREATATLSGLELFKPEQATPLKPEQAVPTMDGGEQEADDNSQLIERIELHLAEVANKMRRPSKLDKPKLAKPTEAEQRDARRE